MIIYSYSYVWLCRVFAIRIFNKHLSGGEFLCSISHIQLRIKFSLLSKSNRSLARIYIIVCARGRVFYGKNKRLIKRCFSFRGTTLHIFYEHYFDFCDTHPNPDAFIRTPSRWYRGFLTGENENKGDTELIKNNNERITTRRNNNNSALLITNKKNSINNNCKNNKEKQGLISHNFWIKQSANKNLFIAYKNKISGTVKSCNTSGPINPGQEINKLWP